MCIISDLQHGPAIQPPFSDLRTLSFFKVLSNSFHLAALWLTVPLAAANDFVFSFQSKKEPAVRWELFPFPVTKNKTHQHHSLFYRSVLTSKVSPLTCAVQVLASFTYSVIVINQLLSLTYIQLVLRAKFLYLLFTSSSLSYANIHTPTLTPHLPRLSAQSLSSPAKPNFLIEVSFLLFGLHALILWYMCLYNPVRADMTLLMPHAQLSFSYFPNIIISNNIMLIELLIVNTIT